MKHKHYDMIVAKAANMDLILFRKTPASEIWEACRRDWMPTDLQDDFFLCLPQHKDACLHWLNGGDLQIKRGDCQYFLDWDRPSREWSPNVSLMMDIPEFRIKPRKEKRWIGVRASDGATTATHNTVQKARSDVAGLTGDWQFIEIEVDV